MKKFPFKLIDLTHTVDSHIPTWDGDCGFEHHIHKNYDNKSKYQFRTHKIKMEEGIGTHMDAPAHCIAGGRTIDKLEVDELISPCVVINILKNAEKDVNYIASLSDITEFEQKYGIIPENSFVIVYSGWDQYWSEPSKYRNNLEFPSISADVANFLIKERNIAGLGIDTLSPDNPRNGYPVHQVILGNDRYIIENVANAGQLPLIGSFVLALPLKIKEGTEAPMRLVAFNPIQT